jgi:hypothetical protein
MHNLPRYWYSSPRYRLWPYRRPLTWEGWLVDVGLAVIGVCVSPLLRADSHHPMTGLGLVFGLLVIYMAIKRWKGEPQRWDD